MKEANLYRDHQKLKQLALDYFNSVLPEPNSQLTIFE